MKHFIQAIAWVFGWVFWLFAAAGGIAGFFSGVPGADETPIGSMLLQVLSYGLKWVLNVIYEQPVLIVFGLSVATILRWVAVYPHADALRKELELERKNARLKPAAPRKKATRHRR